jgi:histidine triad (HIT) family protein
MSCVFCAIVAGESPAEIVHEDEATLGFMDALPMTEGHALLVPKRHVKDLFELTHEDAGHLLLAASVLGKRIVGAMGAAGLNLLNNNGRAADQSQFHLHFHLIPRYGGDRLLHPYERQFGDWTEIRRHAATIRSKCDLGGTAVLCPDLSLVAVRA